jgi:hypothetical protein
MLLEGARGKLQIADLTEQRANGKKKKTNKQTSCCNKTPGDKDSVLTSGRRWWNKNFTKLMKILIDFILFTLNGQQHVILAHINAV